MAMRRRVVHPVIGRHYAPAWAIPGAMPETLMPLSALFRLCLIGLLAGGLAGCGPERDEFPPVCPHPVISSLTSDVTVYRPGATTDHLIDQLYSGRMMGIQGQCKLASDKNRLDTTVQFAIELTRGPAMRGRVVDVPVYLALTEGAAILDKRTFVLRGTFPPNVDTINITTGELEMKLPISAKTSGAAYSVLAGFQLTPEQYQAAVARENAR